MAKLKLNWKYTVAWIIWILLFIVIEALAVINNKKGDTLSEHFWEWFDIKDIGKPRKVMRLAALGGLTWLFVHLLTGGWV